MILAQTTTAVALPGLLDPDYLLTQFGAYAVLAMCLMVFIESSFFPILPGDTLLFTVGIFVARGSIDMSLWLVCLLATVSALLGNVLGYYIGYKGGDALLHRPDSRFFKREYIDKTHEFLDKHGAKAVVLARFVPFVRTFVTWVAGVGRMEPKRYFTYTVIGGILWASGITVLGYFLGQIDFLRNNLDAIFVLVVVISVVPIIAEYLRSRRNRRARRRAAVDTEPAADHR